MPPQVVRLRIGNLAKAVLVTGQSYQDPKDALNEFVSNAADDYAETGVQGKRVRIVLRRRGRRPVIAVDDDGRGMSEERLRQVARGLFDSVKAGDARTLGEKAIGMLAFQQLAARCDIVSRHAGGPTHVLRLRRGQATAELEVERRRARGHDGTTVYLLDLDPDVLRVLTQRKVVDYMRRRRGAALARGDYLIEVIDGRSTEIVTPEVPDGLRLDIPPQTTLWGRIDFALFVAARPDRRRRVAVVGRAGTTIIDDVAELEEFDRSPWTSDQVGGQVVFEALAQTAGRRAIVRDRDAFPLLVEALGRVEPLVARTLEKIAREVGQATADRLADEVRRIFARVLKELADLDNPMRTSVGEDPEGDGLLAEERAVADPPPSDDSPPGDDLGVSDLVEPPRPSETWDPPPEREPEREVDHGAGPRSRSLPTVAPDPAPQGARSRFDPELRVVFYNQDHPDYLLVKDDEAALLEYVAALVAKEYVVYNNPRSATGDVGEEMVRMLVRVRRHLLRRR